jgi:hypothetical protein
MYERLLKVKDCEGYSTVSPNFKPEVWEVLSPDLRTTSFTGTREQCIKYLRDNCPNGSCEE